MEVYIAYLFGVFIGCLIANILLSIRTASGTLKIDHSNPEKDIYRLEIDNLDKFDKKKKVVLKVDHNANLSQQ